MDVEDQREGGWGGCDAEEAVSELHILDRDILRLGCLVGGVGGHRAVGGHGCWCVLETVIEEVWIHDSFMARLGIVTVTGLSPEMNR